MVAATLCEARSLTCRKATGLSTAWSSWSFPMRRPPVASTTPRNTRKSCRCVRRLPRERSQSFPAISRKDGFCCATQVAELEPSEKNGAEGDQEGEHRQEVGAPGHRGLASRFREGRHRFRM